MTSLTGIVAVYDQDPNVLINHLYTLKTQYDRDFAYIIVDYGSSPSYRDKYREIARIDGPFEFVTIARVERETGLWNISRAFNIGIRHTDTEYIFTTGADMLLPPTLIEQVKGLMGPKVYVRAPMIAFSTDTRLRPTGGDAAYYNAVLVMPRAWLVENRGYDERYTLWGSEDEDLIVRLKASGFKDVVADVPPLLHQAHHNRRYEEQAIENRRILTESRGIIKRNPDGWGEL